MTSKKAHGAQAANGVQSTHDDRPSEPREHQKTAAAVANSEFSRLLDRMSDILGEMAEETCQVQRNVSPLLAKADGVDTASFTDLQRLDRLTQYLVELGRMSEGLSRVTARRSITIPDLCRLVRLPSLRNRLLMDDPVPEIESENAGDVSLF